MSVRTQYVTTLLNAPGALKWNNLSLSYFLGAEIYQMSRADYLTDRPTGSYLRKREEKLSRFDESVIDPNSPQDGEMSSNVLAT